MIIRKLEADEIEYDVKSKRYVDSRTKQPIPVQYKNDFEDDK
jgi:hypothetical protein